MKLSNLSKGALKILGGTVGTLLLLGVTGVVNHCQMKSLKDEITDDITARILENGDDDIIDVEFEEKTEEN